MLNKPFHWMRRLFGRPLGARRRVKIKRGVRGELLIFFDGQLASLTNPETLQALKGAGTPIVRALRQILKSGTTEARVEAASLLTQIGSKAEISTFARLIEEACRRGEAPQVLRRATEALLQVGPAGVQAFDQATRRLAPDDLTRLLLIRHAAEQLLSTSPTPPIPHEIVTAWRWALTVYLRRLEWLDRLRSAGKLGPEWVVLEAYGVSLSEERETIPKLIEALNRYSARATNEVKHAS